MRSLFFTGLTVALLSVTLTSSADMSSISSKQDFFTKINADSELKMVYFTADWCGYCEKLKPILNKLNRDYSDKLPIYTVDLDKYPGLAQDYDVTGIPTVVFLKNGKVHEKVVGLRGEKTYRKTIEKFIDNRTAQR